MLAPQTLLNGGAAAAYLTFVAGSDRARIGWPSLVALGARCSGLLGAVIATLAGYRAQRAFSVAQRKERERLEMPLGQEGTSGAGAGDDDQPGKMWTRSRGHHGNRWPWFRDCLVGYDASKKLPPDRHREHARTWQAWFLLTVLLSSIMFLAGVALAGISESGG